MADHNIEINVDINGADEAKKDLQDVKSTVDKLNGSSVRTRIDINTSSVDSAKAKVNQLISILNTASNAADRIGSGFSALGDFSGMFANAFSGMSSMFKFDALGTASRYLTAMATRAVTGQISGIIQRYDIMNTFEDYMTLAGVSSAQANASLNAVDQSIRGIPIGLDEAAFRLRKYQMYMNDIDRATDFTIGIQKAITAGGASESMKTTAYTQIDRLLATGKLGQSRQWLSLFNGLGVSLRFLREELALDPTADLKTIASDLASGAISTDAFIDAIARLSDNEGLDQALEIYKGTIEAWQANINNAVKRGGQKILESINEVMEDSYDAGITGAMKDIRDRIDTVAQGASEYILDNPRNITTIGDAVSGVVERVFSLDAGGFVTKTVGRFGDLFDALFGVFDNLPPGLLEDFTSFAITWAGPMATVMKAAQSGLPAVFGIFDRFKNFDMGTLMQDIVTWGGRFADVVSRVLGVIPDGMLSNLISFGLVWGKPLGAAFSAISTGLKDIAGALGTGVAFSQTNGIVGQLTWLIANHPIIMGVVGAIAAAAIAVQNMRENYRELSAEMLEESGYTAMSENVDRLVEKSDAIREGFETSTNAYRQEVDTIRKNADEASSLLQTILDIDDQINERIDSGDVYDELYAQQLENIEKMQALMPELADKLGLDTQGRLENVAALKEQGDAYVEMVRKQAEAEAMRSQLEKAYEAKFEAEANRQRAEEQQEELAQTYREARQMYRDLTEGKGMETLTEAEYNRLVAAESIIRSYREDRDNLWSSIEEYAKTEGLADEQIDYLAEHLGELNKDMRDMARNGSVSQLDDSLQSVGTEAEAASHKVAALAQSYLDLRDAAEEALVKQQDLWEELDTKNETTLAKSMENIGANLNRYGDANRALATVRSGLAGMELPDMTRGSVAEFASDLIKRGELGQLIELGNMFESGGALEWISNNSMELFANSNANQGSLLSAENVAQLELLKEVGGNIQQWTSALDTVEVSQVLQSAAEAAGEGNADLSSYAEALGQVASHAAEAAANGQAAAAGIDQAGGSAQAKSGSMSSLAGTIRAVAGSASSAASSVSALASAINSLHDKNVHVNVSVGTSIGGGVKVASGLVGRLASNAINALHWPSKGGLIDYLAEGGFPGMGRGTDTIPAWLTPGEFVMRRGAVGMFGSHFMDRVNKMDIGGAFDALMSRIANPMSHGGNTYKDNHSTVNIYNYGNGGQDYSQRKAYRFVGSL